MIIAPACLQKYLEVTCGSPASAFHQQLTYKKTSVEMPRARASVVIVATRAIPLRRDIEKVREVGALRERATSSRPVLAAGYRPARTLFHAPYVARIVSRQARRARQPNQHILLPRLVTPRKLARVSRAHSRNLEARDCGPSRPCTGYVMVCACESRTTAA
jgi:hypothetical protein